MFRSPADPKGSRFVAALAGAVAASLVWLVLVPLVSDSPGAARAERAAPTLPAPGAVVVSTTLQSVAWSPCELAVTNTIVRSPRVQAGYRSVVTQVIRAGARVKTGTRLATVASTPVVAVVTDAVLYRDLRPGDEGADVRGLLTALKRARLIGQDTVVMSGEVVRVWRERFDPSGPADRIRLDSMAAVPAGSVVGNVQVQVDTAVRPGQRLMDVAVGADHFTCDVLDLEGQITTTNVRFQVDGRDLPIARVSTVARTSSRPGRVLLWPKQPQKLGSGNSIEGNLGIEGPASAGAVKAVPLAAVRTSPAGSTEVVLITNRKERAVAVKLGVSAQGLVEIRGSGVEAGDHVKLFSPSEGPTDAPAIPSAGPSDAP